VIFSYPARGGRRKKKKGKEEITGNVPLHKNNHNEKKKKGKGRGYGQHGRSSNPLPTISLLHPGTRKKKKERENITSAQKQSGKEEGGKYGYVTPKYNLPSDLDYVSKRIERNKKKKKEARDRTLKKRRGEDENQFNLSLYPYTSRYLEKKEKKEKCCSDVRAQKSFSREKGKEGGNGLLSQPWPILVDSSRDGGKKEKGGGKKRN